MTVDDAQLLGRECTSSAHLLATMASDRQPSLPRTTTGPCAPENTMNDNTNRGGPNVGLLLLIPAAALVMHAARRHHQLMWDEMGGPESEAPRRRHGHRHFAGPESDTAARDGFRLPPRIEWMLETWHTRAHQATEPTTEAPTA
jgi:hypothetical protein